MTEEHTKPRSRPRKTKHRAPQLSAPVQDVLRDSLARSAPAFALLEALTDAFRSVDAYVATTDRDGEAHRQRVERIKPVVAPAFRLASHSVLKAIADAIGSGNTEDVLWLSSQLAKRRRRNWLEVCRRLGPGSFLPVDALTLLNEEFGPDDARATDSLTRRGLNLSVFLGEIEPSAKALKNEQVIAAFAEYSKPERTIEGFAARLACDCGAFGYKSQHEAQKAFLKASKDKSDDP